MPKRYTAMRDKCRRAGGGSKACKAKAARIYNATRARGTKPVTRRKH